LSQNTTTTPGMDPITKSVLTSVGMSLSMGAVGWAVTKGVVPAADQSVLANDLVLVAGAGLTVLFGWLKKLAVSQPVMMQAINDAPNGAKVVDEKLAVGIPAINEPVK
jgi:hypothetical protein